MRYFQNVKRFFAIFSERAHIMKERIKDLCHKKGISMNKLEETLGFGKGYISKLGTTTPNVTKIKKIADYFNVTVDYLMTGEENDIDQGYYLDRETARQAQEMYEDADMRTLFDMKRKMPADRFSAHVKFMKELYEKENPSE